MKKGTILVVAWLCFVNAHAQQIVEKHINFSGKESVALNIQISDSINIKTWNKNEVYAKGSVNINDNKDNDAYEVNFNESGKTVEVKTHFKDDYFKGKKNHCVESEIYWEVYIPENTSLSVETIDGNISISGKTKDMKIKSISGYIDLSLPESKKADLDFSTISGTMYSNHKLALSKTHEGIPAKIHTRLNEGGDQIKLETISGDIFFRKSN
jgi:hypothetical protein